MFDKVINYFSTEKIEHNYVDFKTQKQWRLKVETTNLLLA